MAGNFRRTVDLTSHIFQNVARKMNRKKITLTRAVVERTLDEFCDAAADSIEKHGSFVYKGLGRFSLSKTSGQIEFVASARFENNVWRRLEKNNERD